MLIDEPPSFVPAVNSNGRRKSLLPGSGFAPMRFSCAVRYSAAARSPGEPARRPSVFSDASAMTCAFVLEGAVVWLWRTVAARSASAAISKVRLKPDATTDARLTHVVSGFSRTEDVL